MRAIRAVKIIGGVLSFAVAAFLGFLAVVTLYYAVPPLLRDSVHSERSSYCLLHIGGLSFRDWQIVPALLVITVMAAGFTFLGIRAFAWRTDHLTRR